LPTALICYELSAYSHKLFNKLSARVPVSVQAAILVSVQAEQKGQYRFWTPGTTGIEVKTQKVQQNHRVDNVSMLYP
jgi:hypothetical protein